VAPFRALRRLLAIVLVAQSSLALVPAQGATAAGAIRWSDVPFRFWARPAIDDVAAKNDWMRDFPAGADGTYPFEPTTLESRQLFARAVVRAFAATEKPDPSVTFADLASDAPFFAFANVAVKLGWMTTDAHGDFLPNDPVTPRMVHRALVEAVGLGDLAAGLDAIHSANGTPFPVPQDFGTLLVGMRIGLRYNHADASQDVGPDSPLPRDEVAWSLIRAATMPSWMHEALAGYATITLPNLGPVRREVVQFGLQYVGFPYVSMGEWGAATPPGYCCGAQPVGGFDCSGLAWWLMKRAEGGWGNQPPRTYRGWGLPQRTAAGMASTGAIIKNLRDVRPGDLLFYDGNGDGLVDHVNVYVGNGWALDSSSSAAGVVLVSVTSGWYRDTFVRARRLIGASAPG
jgi:hypothetical protein